MSLKSFLSKIWKAIKNLFNGIDQELKTAIHISVLIVENIKKFVDSPDADIISAIIPGTVDDQIKDLLRVKLPLILTELKLADSCSKLTNADEVTACAIKTLQELNGNTQNAFLHSLSVIITNVIADGKLTWTDSVYLSEWYYQQLYKTSA